MNEQNKSQGAAYLELIKEVADRFLSQPEKVSEWVRTVDWRGPNGLLGIYAFLAEQTGKPEYAKAARELLPEKETLGSFCVYTTTRSYLTLRRAGILSEDESARFERYLVAQAEKLIEGEYFRHFIGYRVFNHVLMAALGLDYIDRFILGGKAPSAWKELVESVRRDCRALGYPLENASNYEPLSLHVLFFWERFREDRYLAADHRIRDGMERTLQLLSPLGVMADYGDSSWNNNWGLWVACLESAAAMYRDGRFRFAARKILDYQLRHRATWLDGPNLPNWLFVRDVYHLIYALDYLDETIEPRAPTSGTSLVYRSLPHFYQETMTPTRCAPSVFPSGEGERRQDKLIFRSGWGEQDAFLAVELQQRLWHDHFGAPSIILHTVAGSVLLSDSGYWQNRPEFHNTFFLRQAGDTRPFAAGMLPGEQHHEDEATARSREFGKPVVRSLDDFESASFAEIETVAHMGHPVRHRRHIIFAKASGAVFVWDRLRVWEGQYEVGPLLHAQDILSKREHGFVARVHSLHDHKGNAFFNRPKPFLLAFFGSGHTIGCVTQQSFTGSEHEPDPFFANHHCVCASRWVAAPEECGFLTCIVPLSSAQDIPPIDGDADAHAAVARAGELAAGFSKGTGAVHTDAAAWFDCDGVIAFKEAQQVALNGQRILKTGARKFISPLYEKQTRVTGEITITEKHMTVVLHSLVEMDVTICAPRAVTGLSVNGGTRQRAACAAGHDMSFVVRGQLNLLIDF